MQNKNRSLIYLVRRNAFMALLMFVVTFFLVPFQGLTSFNRISFMIQESLEAGELSSLYLRDITASISNVLTMSTNQEILAFGFAGLGFLSAVILFRHLFSRKMTILIDGLPVRRQTDYLERTCVYLIDCLLPTALCLLLYPLFVRLSGLRDYMSVKPWQQIGTLLLIHLYGYSLGTLSAALTGQIWACPAGALFLGMFVEICMVCWQMIARHYLYTFPADIVIPMIRTFSPAFSLYKTLGRPDQFVPWAGVVMTVVYLVLGHLAYSRRPAERTEHPVAFVLLERPLAVLISLTAGTVIGFVFMSILDTEPALLLALAAGTIIAWILCQLLFSLNFRRLFDGLPVSFICAVFLILTVFAIRFDIAGYDRYSPDPARFSEISIDTARGGANGLEHYTLTGNETRTAACTLAKFMRDDCVGPREYHPYSFKEVTMTFGSGLLKKQRGYDANINAVDTPDPDAWSAAAKTLVESDEYRQGILASRKIDQILEAIQNNTFNYYSAYSWRQFYGNYSESWNAYKNTIGISEDWRNMSESTAVSLLKAYKEAVLRRNYESLQQEPVYTIELSGALNGQNLGASFSILPDETELINTLGGDEALNIVKLITGDYAKVTEVTVYKVRYSEPASDRFLSMEPEPVSWVKAETPDEAAEWIRNSVSSSYMDLYISAPVSNEELWLFYPGSNSDYYLENADVTVDENTDLVQLTLDNREYLGYWPTRRCILAH